MHPKKLHMQFRQRLFVLTPKTPCLINAQQITGLNDAFEVWVVLIRKKARPLQVIIGDMHNLPEFFRISLAHFDQMGTYQRFIDAVNVRDNPATLFDGWQYDRNHDLERLASAH